MRKCLLLLFALSLVVAAGSAFANVNYCVNPGFEVGTGTAAPPWSFWGGTGGRIANPFPTGTQVPGCGPTLATPLT